MSRYISDLTAGTLVWVDENAEHTKYIYLGLDNSGNARLLRHYALLAKRMHSSNVAHYFGCEADLWYENEETGFLARFDAATINAMQATTICCSDYTQSADGTVEYIEATRRAFASSYKEMGFGGDETDVSFLPALLTYYGTTNANTARIGRSADETAVSCWLRSASSATQFRYVHASGNAYTSDATVGYVRQRPAISVSPDTIVSDEGADSIFLLPEGRRTYWQVDATCLMGASEHRPKKAKLLVVETDITEATYRVTNNAGDAIPAWVSCANGGVCELANETKETENWQLGVKIDAKAGVYTGNVGEPVLIVETEENT